MSGRKRFFQRSALNTELADTHVHLDRFPAEVVAGMLERARRAGVGLALSVGLSVETSERAIELARQNAGVLPAAGVHPRWLAQTEPQRALEALEELARARRVAAIGEVGLEYAAEAPPAEVQHLFLGGCLDIARRFDLGVSLHVVGAHDDALRVLAERGPVRAVVHYFVGDRTLAERYVEAGCWISVGKPVTRPEHGPLRKAVAGLPLERLLLETDSYPLPDRTTEPRHVVEVCRAVAELRGVPEQAVARATTANFRRFLGTSIDWDALRQREWQRDEL